ncbi:hypothetical protein ACRE_062450 [Hapsidospora chrysogenum ATCC 11550]|uniref:Protein kinase domain-containing protein n=1 Tax=Hapsidospora chrysogenum (strain ATCC 11550 / CBS 779.69 / DSM 880 / IAM 14645 / JCM 23072 / IMI 49137) TaxID=857340 RepID=A0A086T105_HAPC1|nr:hypothetical protein ACRE_062450 [Hapsidospora chrysogenum ATCC 11550]
MKRWLLPRYQGPKLAPFPFKDPVNPALTISGYLGGGLHSHVFEAELDGKKYALKLFKFFDPWATPFKAQLKLGLITLEEVASVCDPFNCECRAYGRLKEVGREDLAIECHGYICLSPEQGAELADRGYDDWCRRDRHVRKPIMGIVKELLDPRRPHFTPKHYDRMRKDVTDRNALGIVVLDIRAENYIDGRLVDLSKAYVSPHPALDWDSTIVPRDMVQEFCTRDQLCFDEMMTDWNEARPRSCSGAFYDWKQGARNVARLSRTGSGHGPINKRQ